MKTVGIEALRALTAEAAASARRRRNLNLHASLDDPIQRLCNAFEPGTYVRPHRHGADVWELFALLAGRAAALTFDASGTVTARAELAPGTVLFEVKHGPYRPTDESDFAAWAPREGDARAAAFVAWMARAAVGERAPG